MNTRPEDQTPIKDALGENYDSLTGLQQAIVGFADLMHQRFKKFQAPDDADEIVSNNEENTTNNLARLLSNVYQLARAESDAVYNDTAAPDVANLALIIDMCQNKKFVA